MKTQKPFFQSLASRERALALNRSLANLLNQAITEIDEVYSLSPLQKNYIISETSYIYQHFGFSIFGHTARQFVAQKISTCSGVEDRILQSWLELLAFTLLEDFNMLKIITGEPDWLAVDKAFFRDLARRILCVENGEKSDIGLDAWSNSLVSELCERTEVWLELLETKSITQVMKYVRESLDCTEFSVLLAESLSINIQIIHQNPLQILVWRLQFLTSFSDICQEAKFFARTDGTDIEAKAFRMAALLALMVRHETPTGETLLPEFPISSNRIANVLRKDYASEQFDTTLFRNWMGLENTHDNSITGSVSALAAAGVQLGLLFEVSAGKRGKTFGPTLNALRILAPFQEIITKTILKTPPILSLAEHSGNTSALPNN